MLKFSANLWYLFPELEMMDRFEAAAGAGFKGVEFHFPYRWPAKDLARKLARHGLEQVQINAPAGDWDAGERGLAALPGREGEFRKSITKAIAYAGDLNCNRIHVMAGVFAEGAESGAHNTYLENLFFAATACAEEGILVLIEPLNPIDAPGYMIGHTLTARAVIDAVGHENLALQYDIYHAAMNGEDIETAIRDNLGVIGHMQVAGVPGRHEPDASADVDYPALFQAIDAMGYGGWIGCEYNPRAGTLEGLGWAAPYGIT